ncbi:MAG: acetylglutamate kinase [Selenomonadaceae bacterium]|nr:acetylglutamate kinase [Selenomonadaceae bacterium]
MYEEIVKAVNEEINKTAEGETPAEDEPIKKSAEEKTSAQVRNFSADERAAILVEALPYIREFHGKTVVIKYGGNAMINEDLKSSVMQDIALMKFVGINVVIVHGGGPEITGFLKKIGKESSFVSGLRVTDEETVEIAEMVLDGKINSEIVMLLNTRGLRAVGLSGKDAELIQARKKLATVYEQGDKKKVDIGYVGKAKQVNIQIVKDLLEHDYVPVIAPIGVGEDGKSYNINADYVAADIAGALNAEKLLLLTDTEGVYKDFDDKKSFISTLKADEARQFIKDGIISGGMIPKVEACLRAIDAGTNKAHIIDGRLPHSIILELFTNSGIGTEVE